MTYEHPPLMVEGALVLLLVGFSLWYLASPDEVYGLVAGPVRAVAEQELVAEPPVQFQAAEQHAVPEGHLERQHRVDLRHDRDGRQRQALDHALARLEVAAMVAEPLALHDFELPAHVVPVLVETGLHALEEHYRAGHHSPQLRGGWRLQRHLYGRRFHRLALRVVDLGFHDLGKEIRPRRRCHDCLG